MQKENTEVGTVEMLFHDGIDGDKTILKALRHFLKLGLNPDKHKC